MMSFLTLLDHSHLWIESFHPRVGVLLIKKSYKIAHNRIANRVSEQLCVDKAVHARRERAYADKC
jgi:hypothetical protein